MKGAAINISLILIAGLLSFNSSIGVSPSPFCTINPFPSVALVHYYTGNAINNVTNDNGVYRNNPPDSIALDNEYVTVMRNSTRCQEANTGGYDSRIIVALASLKFESSKGIITLERGNIAVFLRNESYRSPAGEYFEVSLKSGHPALKKPESWIEPEMNIIVYEDSEFRVFEERLGPGETRALHSHAQRVVVRLNDVQLTDPRTRPLGSPGGGLQVPNTVKFADPVVHVVHNLSKTTPLFNIVIEFKTDSVK